MFRALIADDHPLFRLALRGVVESLFPEREIFEASTLDEALALVADADEADNDLDLILLDLQMPGSTGFSGLIALRRAAPSAPIVVVSAATAAPTMRECVTYGAAGFIPKAFSREQIGDALARVLGGELYLPGEAYDGPPPRTPGLRERFPQLTQAELKVFELMAKGRANKVIAYDLGIKESTVKAHITSILRKLKVHSRTQAAVAARVVGDS